MGKKNRSITVSDEVDEYLRKQRNASGLIDELLKARIKQEGWNPDKI